jgi:hypothetical protein
MSKHAELFLTGIQRFGVPELEVMFPMTQVERNTLAKFIHDVLETKTNHFVISEFDMNTQLRASYEYEYVGDV